MENATFKLIHVKCYHFGCNLQGQYAHPSVSNAKLCERHLQRFFDDLKKQETQPEERVYVNRLHKLISNRELSFTEKIDLMHNLSITDI